MEQKRGKWSEQQSWTDDGWQSGGRWSLQKFPKSDTQTTASNRLDALGSVEEVETAKDVIERPTGVGSWSNGGCDEDLCRHASGKCMYRMHFEGSEAQGRVEERGRNKTMEKLKEAGNARRERGRWMKSFYEQRRCEDENCERGGDHTTPGTGTTDEKTDSIRIGRKEKQGCRKRRMAEHKAKTNEQRTRDERRSDMNIPGSANPRPDGKAGGELFTIPRKHKKGVMGEDRGRCGPRRC